MVIKKKVFFILYGIIAPYIVLTRRRRERMDKKTLYKIHGEITQLRRQQEFMNKKIDHLEELVKSYEMNIEPDEEQKQHLDLIQEDLDKKDLEQRIGGTWFNRIGVVAVILGLAYFLKYSFDNEWIGPTARVLLGLLIGIGMIGLGEKLRKRYSGYAQGLFGGGSLALFFSIYSGYSFYELISSTTAFILLIFVMIFTVFLSIRHQSLPIGILGIIGGYLTPFLVGSEDPSTWVLVSYLLLLTTGVLIVSIFQKWATFQYLSFFINQLIFAGLWAESRFSGHYGDEFSPLITFQVIIFVLYLGVATIYNIRHNKKANYFDLSLILLNAFAFFAWSNELLSTTFLTDYMGYYALFIAFIYILLGRMANRIGTGDKALVYTLFLVSFVMITISIPLQLDGVYIGIAWFAQSVGFMYMAQKLKNIQTVYSSLAVLVLGLMATYLEVISLDSNSSFFFNQPTLLLILSIISVVLIIYIVKSMERKELQDYVLSILTGLLLFLIFISLTVENRHFFSIRNYGYAISPEQLSLSALWLIFASVLFVIGLKKQVRYLRYVSLGLFAIVIVKAIFVDLASLETIYKILLFVLLGFVLLAVSYVYQKKKDSL